MDSGIGRLVKVFTFCVLRFAFGFFSFLFEAQVEKATKKLSLVSLSSLSLSPLSHLVVVEPHEIRHGRLARGSGPTGRGNGRNELALVEAAAARERSECFHELLEAQPLGSRVAARGAGPGECQVDVRRREPAFSRRDGFQEPRGADEFGEARAVDLGRGRRRQREGRDRRPRRRARRTRGAAGSEGGIGEEDGTELLARCCFGVGGRREGRDRRELLPFPVSKNRESKKGRKESGRAPR